MKLEFKTVLGALALSIVGGLIVAYLSRKFWSPQGVSAQQQSWCCFLNCGALPNLNSTGANPAISYPHGAPVTNYRRFLRVGQTEVAAS